MAKLEDVILRGTTLAKPAANAVPVGTLYFDTDLETLERSSGAAWETYAPTGGGAGSDTTAIHDNVASEISAIAEKAVPIAADMIIIEDSADGNAKKMAQVGNLPGGGGGAGSPVIFPHSTYPVTGGRVFPNFHVGAGANSKYDEGLGVKASVDADSTWALRFQMPPVLPAGTGKLRLLALANSVANAAKVNPKWVSVAVEEDPSSAALNAEGTQTITWAAGDADVYKELKVILDADVITASEEIVMSLVFETAAWTLAVVSTWIASIIWE